MKHIRSLSLFLSFLLSSFSLSATESINSHLTAWKTTYLDQMKPQEINILGNILLNLFANALIDEKIQKLLSPLDRLTQAVRSNIADQQSPDEEIALLKRHLEKLSYVTGTRTIYTHTLNRCLAHYNENRTDLIDAAIETLQLYSQNALCAWADENAESTQQLLATTAKNFTESSQFFYAAAGLYKGLSEGMLPTLQPEQYKSLMIIDALLKSNPQLLQTTDSIANMINYNADHAMNIICTGLELYKQHYTALYSMITAPSFDKRYAKTMFSMHGLLPEEYTSPLPHPDHVFEHMLQTTKLYTQTELIQ